MDDGSKPTDIDQIIEKARQYLQEKDYKYSAALVKNALEAYPKNKKLSELYSQIKNQYKEEKIQKLQEEAIMFMQTGAEDQAQIRLRQILQLDPTRTELVESLRTTRSESSAMYHKRMKHAELIHAILRVVLISFTILAIFCWWAGWNNNRHLKKAEKLIVAGDLYGAKQSFEKCGWFWASKRHKIDNDLQAAVNSLMEQGRNCIKLKNFAEAISYFERAELAAKDVAAVKQQIEDCRRDEKLWQEESARLELEKERQRVLSDKALAAKEEFSRTFADALENKADVDAKALLEDCNSMAVEAEKLFVQDNFELSSGKWVEATSLCQEAIRIAKEINRNREGALTEKLKCNQLAETAKKMRADAILPDVLQQGQESYKSAEKYFSETNFEKAKQDWLLAAGKFGEAIQAAMQSPDFKKATLMSKRWSILKPGMADSDIRQLLGSPKRIQAASDGSIWYYQSIPCSMEVGQNSYKCVDVAAGYIRFTILSHEAIAEEIQKIYQKYISDEHNGHEDILASKEKEKREEESRHSNNDRNISNSKIDVKGRTRDSYSSSSDREAARSREMRRHKDKLALIANSIDGENQRHTIKISEYENARQTKLNNLTNGLLPRDVRYVVSDWIVPDQTDIVSLLSVDEVDSNSIKPTCKWHFPIKWKSLNLNIREDDVRTALGMPETMSSDGNRIIYTYGNVAEYGVLIFETRIDSSKRLSYWKEPLWSQVRYDLQKAVLSNPNQSVAQTSNTE